MNRRDLLARSAKIGAAAGAMALPVSKFASSSPAQRAAERLREAGLRVDALNPRSPFAGSLPGLERLRFDVWAPARDPGSHIFVGWIDRAGRFISERTPPWAIDVVAK